MTIPPDLEAKILRYHHVEKWRVHTIAAQLGVHHYTVRRVLAQAGLMFSGTPPRPSRLDPYLPFIRQTLERFPTLTASRLYAMVCARGYQGSPDHFRHFLARYRPRPQAEAFLRLSSLPGEQAQVDWAHCGHLTIGRARRPVMAFVMVLSHSRDIALRFFLSAGMDSFLAGHHYAFQRWGGVPRVLLYDNLKSAVIEREGTAIRFNPTLLAFANHYRFDPRPVGVARGNEKGRVERAIRYIRDNFLAARPITDLDTLNREAEAWSCGPAADRRCPGDPDHSVRDALAAETPFLLPLPANPFPPGAAVPVTAGKTPYVRFDGNDYSIPHTHVRRTLTVLAEPHHIRIVDGDAVLASHARHYGKGEQIEQASHIQTLADDKRAARQHRAGNRLATAAPASTTLITAAAGRGDNLGTLTAGLLRLLDRYGGAELDAAIGEALAADRPYPADVRLILERRREHRNAPPPIAPALPDHVRTRDVAVRPHRLATYDTLKETADD
jgi:transposase